MRGLCPVLHHQATRLLPTLHLGGPMSLFKPHLLDPSPENSCMFHLQLNPFNPYFIKVPPCNKPTYPQTWLRRATIPLSNIISLSPTSKPKASCLQPMLSFLNYTPYHCERMQGAGIMQGDGPVKKIAVYILAAGGLNGNRLKKSHNIN